MLTSINAAILVVLIAIQGVTVVALDSMIRIHLFIGVVLLGPVALKLAATGYRFVRYYSGAREYRVKGPPPLLLRAIAPIFVASTIGLFATGVVMLLNGEAQDTTRALHVLSFWVWLACLAIHVALNAREVLRNLHGEWLGRARDRILGAQIRGLLVVGASLGGVMVALALASEISGYHYEGGG